MNREPIGQLVTLGYKHLSKIHSEVDAYKKVKGILVNDYFECVNIRLNKQHQLRMAAPCRCCQNFLNSVGCNKVFFSTEMGIVELNIGSQ